MQSNLQSYEGETAGCLRLTNVTRKFGSVVAAGQGERARRRYEMLRRMWPHLTGR